MKKSEPQLSEEPRAFVIGVAERDMFISGFDWPFAFNMRQGRYRVASTARMHSNFLYGGGNPEAVEVRLRKTVIKNIALLSYHLPESSDPTSVARLLNPSDDFSLYEIDVTGENLIGEAGVWQPAWKGADPCITVYQPATGPPILEPGLWSLPAPRHAVAIVRDGLETGDVRSAANRFLMRACIGR